MRLDFPVVEKSTLSTILSEKDLHGALYVAGEVLFITWALIYVLLGLCIWLEKCHLTAPEKDEVKRRKLLWVLYRMRDPFFSRYTRRRLEGTENTLEHIPVVGFLAAKLVELITGAQTRYTYMSGS